MGTPTPPPYQTDIKKTNERRQHSLSCCGRCYCSMPGGDARGRSLHRNANLFPDQFLCLSLFPCSYRFVPCLFLVCSRFAPALFPLCSRFVPALLPLSSHYFSGLFPDCSRFPPSLFPEKSRPITHD